MNEYKALIFDLGKVIFDLSFDRVFQSWATTSGSRFEDIKSNFQFDTVSDDFEKRQISPEHFREIVLKRLNIKLSDKEFDMGWCNLYLDKYAGVDNLLANLKAKYRLVALTNTNAIHNNTWRMKYADTLTHFEKVFSSHELATRKPENKIYEIVLEYLKLKPEQTIFLDDNIDNINGAKNLGIKTILVESYEQMMGEMKQIRLIDERINSL